MKTRIASSIVAILLLGLLGTGVAQSASGTKTIRDDATGGDCTTIGNWDLATKTCTLKMNLTDSIVIMSNGITLDGHGHKITGSGTGSGISIGLGLLGLSGVTIKNLTVSEFESGIINPFGAAGFNITHNTLRNNGIGILLAYATGVVSHNTVSNNRDGISLIRLGHRTISDNVFSDNKLAMRLNDDDRSVFTNNTFMKNGALMRIEDVAHSEFYNNTFIDNGQPLVEPGGNWGGIFNFPAPIGGNYWSDYHTRRQDCRDLNHDGFCDAPYVLRTGSEFGGVIQDNLAWTKKNGWLQPK